MHDGRFREVEPGFWLAPQLAAADFAAAAAIGIRTVINNRPDGEAADQLADEEARAAAEAAGLAYLFVPVVSGAMTGDDIAAFGRAVDTARAPVLAYCRSGTRSCFLWAFSAARSRSPETVVEAAAAAGYDLSPAIAALRAIHAAG